VHTGTRGDRLRRRGDVTPHRQVGSQHRLPLR
jgi:hypothetical protein